MRNRLQSADFSSDLPASGTNEFWHQNVIVHMEATICYHDLFFCSRQMDKWIGGPYQMDREDVIEVSLKYFSIGTGGLAQPEPFFDETLNRQYPEFLPPAEVCPLLKHELSVIPEYTGQIRIPFAAISRISLLEKGLHFDGIKFDDWERPADQFCIESSVHWSVNGFPMKYDPLEALRPPPELPASDWLALIEDWHYILRNTRAPTANTFNWDLVIWRSDPQEFLNMIFHLPADSLAVLPISSAARDWLICQKRRAGIL